MRRAAVVGLVLAALVLAAWIAIDELDLPDVAKDRLRRALLRPLFLGLALLLVVGGVFAAPWYVLAGLGAAAFTVGGGWNIAADVLGLPKLPQLGGGGGAGDGGPPAGCEVAVLYNGEWLCQD